MARNSAYSFVCFLVLILATDSLPVGAQTAPLDIRIGSSATNKLSSRAADAVCELMGRTRKRYHAVCEVDEQQTPYDVLTRLQAGQLQAAVLGADWQQGQSDSGLRALFALDDQPLTILVRKDIGDTLKDKRIHIWNRADHDNAFQVLKDHFSDASFVEDVSGQDNAPTPAEVLCDQEQSPEEEIDAVVLFTAHPSPLVRTAIDNGCATLVPLPQPAIQALMQHPYYREATIPANMYKETPEIQTVAVGTTFVSWDNAPQDKVYVVVSTVFENFRRFQVLYSPADQLNPDEGEEQNRIINAFRSAPWHPGAAKYFAKVNWESWFYVIIASFESDQKANQLAGLLQDKFGDSDISMISNLSPGIVRAHNGAHAVSASEQPLKKPDATALLNALRKLKLGIKGEIVPTALFFPKSDG
ncbi:TAXI family TRAP transporter solute-binding subunit [Candidatus Entotheonella palauensis]|uniref:TAXI family TRAP transporter solute-binding subunit n=1 Tax=Candidatus Entotheonella palauensis TaxID=93172 RepID=UPI000B7FE203|nr:TAXI family TRAP transporter solute-binding subunit [Candidatus Entotheonella palauensis]